MTVVDFLILVFLVFFLLQGLWKGLLSEVFCCLAIGLGIIAAMNFHQLAADKLRTWVEVDQLAQTLGFAGVYLIVWLPIKLMGWSLRHNHHEKESRPWSRLSGGLLGLAKGVLIVAFMVASAEQAFPHNKITGHNFLTPELLKVADLSRKYTPFLPN